MRHQKKQNCLSAKGFIAAQGLCPAGEAKPQGPETVAPNTLSPPTPQHSYAPPRRTRPSCFASPHPKLFADFLKGRATGSRPALLDETYVCKHKQNVSVFDAAWRYGRVAKALLKHCLSQGGTKPHSFLWFVSFAVKRNEHPQAKQKTLPFLTGHNTA